VLITRYRRARALQVAWPCGAMGDAEYLLAWERVLMPIARVSRPFPSSKRPVLTEIYLYHAASGHELLTTETVGQAFAPDLVLVR
jgi:hypothetical protein